VGVLTVGVVPSQRRWRQELSTHVRDHVADIEVRVLRDPDRIFDDGALDVVVVDDTSTFLSAPLLHRARRLGVRLVGVFDPVEGEGQGRSYLAGLGVEAVVPATMPADEILDVVRSLRLPMPESPDMADLAVRAGLTPDPMTGFGVVTAVGGPPGAGTTEVAIGLAQRLAHRRLRVVLVDCNEADSGLGVRLGLAPDGGVVAAAEAVRLDERPVEACFARRLDGRRLPFEVISGVADVKAWPQLREGDIGALFEALRMHCDEVVIDTSPHCEEMGHGLAERWAATRAGLRAADRLIGVCPATATGVTGFVRWLGLVADAGLHQDRVLIAVNRVRRRQQARVGEIEAGLRNHLGAEWLAAIRWLAEDDAVADAAWSGGLVRASRWGRAVDEIAGIVAASRPTAAEATRARA